MNRTRVSDLLAQPRPNETVSVAGWVRTRRDSKAGISFVALNDGSCFDSLQIVVDAALPNYADDVKRLHPGASIMVEGRLVPSQGAEQSVELVAATLTVIGFSDPERYPLGKQRISFERLRELAHLRPRTNTFGAVARIRHALAMAMHAFFDERHFLYLQTPIVTCSDCEGAGEMFQVTTLPLSGLPGGGREPDYAADFFGERAGLTVSGQLEAEAYACALGNVYTFGPTFRAENSNTRRHLAEFWMVEPEMAFAGLDEDIELADTFIRHLARTLLSASSRDLAFLNDRIDTSLVARLERVAVEPFERISYTEAIERLARSGQSFEHPVRWGAGLQAEHERWLTEAAGGRAVVVTDYPKEIKAFYMLMNDDERTVAAMDVLLPGIGEIIGGSCRESRFERLVARMKDCGLDPERLDWYLDLRRFGGVPHAGFGMGFERMVLYCTGMNNIRDCIPFPRTPGAAKF